MEGLRCGERDICIHMYVLTHVSHVSTHVTTRVEPPYKLVSLCRVFKACKLGDRQQGETRSEASSVTGTTGGEKERERETGIDINICRDIYTYVYIYVRMCTHLESTIVLLSRRPRMPSKQRPECRAKDQSAQQKISSAEQVQTRAPS